MTILKASIRAVLCAALLPLVATASSHREAPFITGLPKVDGTDFYMFNSYETGRDAYVTLIANYVPLQDAYGGPNYFELDHEALYEIHLDNNADAVEDITFQFRFDTEVRGVALNIGGEDVPIPLKQAGGVGPAAADDANLNVVETYTVDIVTGDRAQRHPAIDQPCCRRQHDLRQTGGQHRQQDACRLRRVCKRPYL